MQAGTPKKEVPLVGADVYYGMDRDVMEGDASLSTDREWHGNEFLQERFQKPFFEL